MRGDVFSNLDGLFAFQTSGEDAHYLVDELGGGLEVQDVMEMEDHECYADDDKPKGQNRNQPKNGHLPLTTCAASGLSA